MLLEQSFSSYCMCPTKSALHDFIATAECTASGQSLASSALFLPYSTSSCSLSWTELSSNVSPIHSKERQIMLLAPSHAYQRYGYQSLIFSLHLIHPKAFFSQPFPPLNILATEVARLRHLLDPPAPKSIHNSHRVGSLLRLQLLYQSI